MRRIWKILKRLTIAVLTLFVVLLLLLQSSQFQTWITQKLADSLSETLNTHIEIGGVDIEFFTGLVLLDLYVEDQLGDTLIYTPKIVGKQLSLLKQNHPIDLGVIEIYNPRIFITKHAGDSLYNLNFLVDYFSSFQDSSQTESEQALRGGSLRIHRGYLKYSDLNAEEDSSIGNIDWNHIVLNNWDFNLSDFNYENDTLTGNIEHLALTERSGFELKNIESQLFINHEKIVAENLILKTPESDLQGRIAFKFKEWADFSDFNNKIKMNHNLTETVIQLSDLQYFAPALAGLEKSVTFSGKIQGKVKNLKGKNLEIQIDDHTRFLGDISMNGLPNIEETFITLDVEEFTSNEAELKRIPVYPFDKDKFLPIPDNFDELGQLEFTGNFIGFINDFTAYGLLETDIGDVESDITLTEQADNYHYSGELSTHAFDLGKFYNNATMGQLSSKLVIEGTGLRKNNFDAEIDGLILAFEFNDYLYHNIEVEGTFKNSFFNGLAKIEDDNLFMNFDGKIDMTTSVPKFSFYADIENIDLVDLNFVGDDKYRALSAAVSADFSGLDPETIVGRVNLSDITYCTDGDECSLNEIFAQARNLEGGRSIAFNSSIATGALVGDFDLDGLQMSIQRLIGAAVPSYEAPESHHEHQENFNLHVVVHDYSLINRFFTPQLFLAPNTVFNLTMDEAKQEIKCTATGDSLFYDDYQLFGSHLDLQQQDSVLYFNLMSDQFSVDQILSFTDFSVDGRTETDTVFISTTWDSQTEQHGGDINGRFTIRGNKNIDFTFNRSNLMLAGKQWNFNPKGSIKMDAREIDVHKIRLSHQDQFIELDGLISESPQSSINLTFKDFDIANVNPLLDATGVELDGRVDGFASFTDYYHEKLFTSNLGVDGFAINQKELGDMELKSTWISDQQILELMGQLVYQQKTPLYFSGNFTPSSNTAPLDLRVTIDSLRMDFLNALIPAGISNIDGTVSGNIHLTGIPSKPELNGQVDIDGLSVKVDYLNTTYSIDQSAKIVPEMFMLDGIRITDEEGNTGTLVGTVAHDNFANWNYDMAVFLDDDYFLCLNTTEEDNSTYFGKAYGKGDIYVSGFEEKLELEINMSTGPDTQINLPLGGSEEVAFEDFVSFVTEDVHVEEKLDLSGIDMQFILDITPDAEFQIIFDQAVGDVMKGRGKGVIDLNISSSGLFEMTGDLEVVEGNYLFTLKNIINKEFDIQEGGKVIWTGDPLGAELDMATIYKLSSPLNDILSDNSGMYNQRVPVDLVMNLSGAMLNPQINFEIDLPESNQLTKSRVEAVLGTEQELNRQAFALLIMRRFVAPPNVGSSNPGGGILAENSLEMLSNQLGLWLQGITDKFDIGFDYRPGDEITNEEISLALSTQLFNDRLSVSGNFGVSQGNEANQNPNSIIGDLKLEYKITEDGKIRLVVFNESNQFELASTTQSPYTQGVGILYKEEFDTMEEFYCGFQNLLRKKDNQINCNEKTE